MATDVSLLSSRDPKPQGKKPAGTVLSIPALASYFHPMRRKDASGNLGSSMAPVVPDDRARQGRKGRPVLMVLVGSLVLLGLYMIGMMMWSGSTSPDSASQNASRQATTGSPTGSGSGASSSNTSGVPAANPAYPSPATPTANPSADKRP